MSYLNLSAATKGNRTNQIISALGSAGYAMFYSGSYPLSPDDLVPSGDLLAALPLSSTAGTVVYSVQNAAVNAGGSGGTNGTQTVTGTTGTGTKFQASVTVSGGAITAVLSITVAGSYSALPTNLNAEPVTGASLSGATLSLAMTGAVSFNAITTENASATGTAGFCRLATGDTAGGTGMVDLDVGTSGASVIVNTTSFVSGGPVVVSSATITEA
jgi:hypothetical protein